MSATDAPDATSVCDAAVGQTPAEAARQVTSEAKSQASKEPEAATPAKVEVPPALRGNADQDSHTSQVVSFRLGEEEYGVNIMTVQEIILLGCITQVPEVPEHVLGVINLRGNVIPILNLRRRFGMPDQEPEDATRIVVMNLNGRTVGVVVDAVSEVLRLSLDDISPTPQSLSSAGKDYITGLAQSGERLLILLDMARLLGGNELGEITNQISKGES
ncbi:MAG: purine-binding chemotaxis protein CheW [Planctomycetota bacterium]|jgi:purine-binding chemotaxis protein CheW